MKPLIKTLLRERLIDEEAATLDSLSNDAALFLSNNGNSIRLVLYSSYYDHIYGMIVGDKVSGKDTMYVRAVASEKGYGPLMYELLMSTLYPRYIRPHVDGEIQPKAWNIWVKFYDRKDIEKKEVPIDDNSFSMILYKNGEFDNEFIDASPQKISKIIKNLDDITRKNLLIFNTEYRGMQNIAKPLLDKGKQMVQNGEVDIEELEKVSHEYFNEKYGI